jgi:glucose/arabinose dehydrogenase
MTAPRSPAKGNQSDREVVLGHVHFCEYNENTYGLILSTTQQGEDVRIEARGVRDSMGFDWQPQAGNLWFTDNGRDWVSDDLPPDELNRITAPGLDFGFPYCHGGFLEDHGFPRVNACVGTIPPIYAFPAHVAPLGMRFYTGDMFPPDIPASHSSRSMARATRRPR